MSRLMTIKDIAVDVQVSERTLRDVISALGYSRPLGRKRYLLSAAQVRAITEAVQCRATTPQAPAEEIVSSLSEAVSMATNTNSARLQIAERVRQRLGMSSRAGSRKIVSLEAERQRHSTKRFDYTKLRGI